MFDLSSQSHRKMDMRFETWNVRSLYSAGSLKTVAWELVRLSGCTGGDMGEGGAPNGHRIIHFSVDGGMGIISWGQVFFVHKRIVSAVRREIL
jgi:hypothetical protein